MQSPKPFRGICPAVKSSGAIFPWRPLAHRLILGAQDADSGSPKRPLTSSPPNRLRDFVSRTLACTIGNAYLIS